MPEYLYRCNTCEKVVRIIKPMNRASNPSHCPDCGERMTRIISPAFVKGNHTPKFHGG